jgi:hypothetical protein
MFFDEEFEEDEKKKLNMSIAKSVLLHIFFIIPIAYIFFFYPARVFSINPWAWISVIIHEFGHFLFRLLTRTTYPEVLGGTLLEYIVPTVMIVLCAKNRRSAVLALIFIACIGTNLPYTANYMESASSPHGTGYLSGAPVTKANHDWYYLLSRWHLLGQEGPIGKNLRAIGDVLMLVGIIGSTAGLAFLFRGKPLPFAYLLLMGAALSIFWFLLKGQTVQLEISMAVAFFAFCLHLFERYVLPCAIKRLMK